MYMHGMTFGGHPVQAAVALKNIEIMRREHISSACASRSRPSAPRSSRCSSCRSFGELRGAATSTRSSWSRTRGRNGFDEEECEQLLRGFVSPELFERG